MNGIGFMLKNKMKLLVILIGIIFLIILIEQDRIKHEKEKESDSKVNREHMEESEKETAPEIQKWRQPGAMETIRVLIRNDDYQGIYHDKIKLSSDSEIELTLGTLTTILKPTGEHEFTIEGFREDYGHLETMPIATIRPLNPDSGIALSSIRRSQELPVYRGIFEIRLCDEGFVIINELNLEEYLYAVVPSEMPANYPFEALKAQAICARTYAMRQMLDIAYPEFQVHVDDSTNFQVYHNIAEQDSTTKAVNETRGRIVCQNGELIETCYYSTSCGAYADERVFSPFKKQTDCEYLQTGMISEKARYTPKQLAEEENFAKMIMEKNEDDYEFNENWYRWSCEVSLEDLDEINRRIKERYQKDPTLILSKSKEEEFCEMEPPELMAVKEIKVLERSEGGVIIQLLLRDEEHSVKIISQNHIRYVLAGGCDKIKNNFEEESQVGTLLPSAFFTIQEKKNEDGMITSAFLIGGGNGHGGGMSQNGAKCMAQKGMNAQKILDYFYHDIEIITLGENE